VTVEDGAKFAWGVLPGGSPKTRPVPHFTPHCLRHSYASILLADGVSPVYVQEQFGHATIELTFQPMADD